MVVAQPSHADGGGDGGEGGGEGEDGGEGGLRGDGGGGAALQTKLPGQSQYWCTWEKSGETAGQFSATPLVPLTPQLMYR